MEWLELFASLFAYFVYNLDEGSEKTRAVGKWQVVHCRQSYYPADLFLHKGDFIFLDFDGRKNFEFDFRMENAKVKKSEKSLDAPCRMVMGLSRNRTVEEKSNENEIVRTEDADGVLIYAAPEIPGQACSPLWISYWCYCGVDPACTTHFQNQYQYPEDIARNETIELTFRGEIRRHVNYFSHLSLFPETEFQIFRVI